MMLATAAIGTLLIALGFESLTDRPWFAWMDIALGVLAVLSAHGVRRSASLLAPLGPIMVGAVTMVLCIAGALSGISRPLVWGTLGAGFAALGIGALPVLTDRRRR